MTYPPPVRLRQRTLRSLGAALSSVSALLTVGLLAAPAAQAAPCPYQDTTHSGSSPADAIEITLASDVTCLQSTTADWGKYFRQVADIDMGNPTAWSTGIGTNATPFSGGYDGDGHVISGLTITSTSETRTGLFGNLSGSVTGLGFVGTVTGPNNSTTGGLVGRIATTGSVTDSWADATVAGGAPGYTGGLAGTSFGTIRGTHATGSVSGGDGGYVGGLVGFVQSPGRVSLSYATGSVTSGQDSFAGGMVGVIGGAVATSYATGGVTAGAGGTAGGLAGALGADANPTLTDSYATGPVQAGGSSSTYVGIAGGLVGSNEGVRNGVVSTSYSNGLVTGGTAGYRGGLVGVNNATVSTSFWDVVTSGNSNGTSANSTGTGSGTAATTAQMRTESTFASAAWSITSGWSASSTWGICAAVNSGFPFLTGFYATNPCIGGTSTAEFTFWLEDGRECTSISPRPVIIGGTTTLPDAAAECLNASRAPGHITGWRIPGGTTFAPGRVLPVSDSQQFTAVVEYDWIDVVYDANVGSTTDCLLDVRDAAPGDRARQDWYPRDLWGAGVPPRLTAQAPCVPPGHRLTGWTDRRTGTTYDVGSHIPAPTVDADRIAANTITLYATWEPTG